ncbi:MAG TPA: o-succinylbenzoate--CoA ligase [Candidatus Limnocylindria bacterium]|nr:o-succinylbenzoate--CoA ligase [Candidatus Limnocylindria bacterium]
MTVREPLAANAASRPGEDAVVGRGVHWTWRDLEAISGRMAMTLAEAGVGEASRVAVLADDGPGAVAAIHAARRIGAILVPLNRRAAPRELGRLVAQARPAVLIHDEGHGAVAAEVSAMSGATGVHPRAMALEWLLESQVDAERAVSRRVAVLRDDVDPAAPATIVFTSGTTGQQKGAILTQGNHLASARAWAGVLRPAPTDRWLACLPFHHVAGLAMVLRSSLWGVPLHLASGFEPAAIWRAFDEDGISHCSIVGSTLRRLVDARDGRPAPPTLRAVLVGAERTPPDWIRAARRLGLPVMPTYGATETASGVTALQPADADRLPGSAGRPLPGVEMRIAIGEGGGAGQSSTAGAGEIGEIEVRGGMVFAGYDGQPEAIATVLAGGWLPTGDLGSLDADGFLTVADRRDDLIVSGGENVYPAEVEAVLREHPAVVDAAVVGRPDPRWGAVPVALVVLADHRADHPDASPTDAALIAHCRSRLAAFKVPVAFRRVDAIPRTANGKLRRAAARLLLEGSS